MAVSLLVGALVVSVAFVAGRLRATYAMQTDLAALLHEHVELQREYRQLARETSARLDDLERVLFGDVIKKLMSAKPTPTPITPSGRLQQWMVNRDKELRERVDRLERWRLDQDKHDRKP